MQQKVRDMNEILRKNNRLKYILSEIQNKEMCIVDPMWHPSEIPESVITVQEHEVWDYSAYVLRDILTINI